ncbi:MAG: hypothetical protein ACREDL_15290 [Bradyrhizobium sp.]
MKLIDLLANRRGHRRPGEIDPSTRLASDRSDRSSMAELVRLLQTIDEAQRETAASGRATQVVSVAQGSD